MNEDQEQERAEGQEPKLLVAEIIFGHLIYGVADLISWAEVGVPVMEFVITPVSIWYLKKRGLGGVNTVVRYLVGKLIPGVSLLPIFTISWVAVWWIDRHPQLEVGVEKVGELAGKRGGPAAPGAVTGELEGAGAVAPKAPTGGPHLEAEGERGRMIEATGSAEVPPSREVTEQDFGIAKSLEKPLEAAEEELLERPAVDEFAAARERRAAEEIPVAGEGLPEKEREEQPDWEMEKRMNTGLAALHEPEEGLSELPFSPEPDLAPPESEEEENGETINLRRAA